MKKILIISLLTLVLAASNPAQNSTVEFKGVLKTPNSAVFAGLHVIFSRSDGKVTTALADVNGEFTTLLSAGKYEITVNQSISSKFMAFIEIQPDAINPNNVELIIEPNSLCCGQSADNIYPKVLKSVTPNYPPAARAVRAVGDVVVAVNIDKDGKVTSAKYESGHPLLRAASEQAARDFLFEPSENSNERQVKLVFVFISLQEKKKDLKHYSNPYRIEIESPVPTIQSVF